MTETQRRINAYKEALPGLKERVIAAVMLLVLSTTMMASATFAWLTASEKPEAAGTMTQVSANGNLEIALVKPIATDEEGNPIYPDASQVGDSTAAEGQTVYNSNQTWGNLLNLSDSSYGLQNIVLRPAKLKTSSLGTKPFESVLYGADGRVTVDSNSEFSYFTWVTEPEDGGLARFLDTGYYGVRAIASATSKYEGDIADGDLAIVTTYRERLKEVENANSGVNTFYQNSILGSEHMQSLFTLMGHYMTNNMNASQDCDEDTKDPKCTAQLKPLASLFDLFYQAMELEISAIVKQVNLQLFVKTGGTDYVPYTEADFLNLDNAGITALVKKLKNDGCQVTDLESFLKDMNSAKIQKATVDQMAADAENNGTEYRVSSLKTVINSLVNVGTSVITWGSETYTINQIGATIASGMSENDAYYVEIQDGILARFERRAGAYANLEHKSVTATGYRIGMKLSRTLKDVTIYTKYKNTQENLFADDLSYTENLFANSDMDKGELVWTVGDTYGLAIDMWVRTNAIGDETGKTYLVLEGQLVYEQRTGLDANGNEVGLLYYYETENADGTKTKNYVYQATDGTWYTQNTSDTISVDGKLLKEAYADAPTGYEGNNRVWQVDQQGILQPALSEYATTQGNGSSFTFYADTPAQQQAILNLLSHLYVVFTDGGDSYYSTAVFDTRENAYYARGGKITVPLVIRSSQYSYVDADNVVHQAVMPLSRNEATRVTAILYLDGTQLSNKEALTAADLSGTLNLQFGSSDNLISQTDRELQAQERFVSAELKSAEELDFFTSELKATVDVKVTGDKPGNVTAFFQREINSYQGSRGETVVFTQSGDLWTADFTFAAPGNYVMRSVMLDGVEYELTEPIRVTVLGFTMTDLALTYEGQYLESGTEQIMTADTSVTLDAVLKFASNDPNKMPKSVRLEFLRAEDSSIVGVNMVRGTDGSWSGSVTFNSSGVYSAYVILDRENYDLGAQSKTLDISVGLYASIQASGATVFALNEGESAVAGVNLEIKDNSNAEARELNNVSLYYKPQGSSTELYTQLQWDVQYDCYVGNFQIINSGTYEFVRLEVGENVINKAKQAPIFSVSSNEPVSFISIDSATSHFVLPGGDPVNMLVKLKNTGGASIVAVFTDASGKEYIVENTDTERVISITHTDEETKVSTWKIRLPGVMKAEGFNQDGEWTLKELRLGNVRDEDSKYYTDAEPMVVSSFSGYEDRQTVTVVSSFTMRVNPGTTVYENGQFLGTYTKNDLTVDLYFGENEAIPDVKEMKLIYTYRSGSSLQNGYYTSNKTPDPIEITMKADETGTLYTQSADAYFSLAGVYELSEIKLTIGARTINYPRDMSLPTGCNITVKSNKPTVTITGVTPAPDNTTEYGFYTVTQPADETALIRSTTYNRYSDYSASVYMYVVLPSGCDSDSYKQIQLPEVQMKLSGVAVGGDKISASVAIGNKSNSSGGHSATFNSSLTAALQVGYATNTPVLYPAGLQTIEKITVEYEGSTYEVELEHKLEIDNPLIPYQVTYVVEDATFTGVLPEGGFNPSGTVTLPTYDQWVANMASPADRLTTADFVEVSREVTSQVYTETTTGSGCNASTTYTPYTTTKIVSQAESVSTSWTESKRITGWKVGDTVYRPGATVKLTENVTITAVIEVISKTDPVPDVTVFTMTVVETVQGNNTSSQPSGSKVDVAPTTGSTTTYYPTNPFQ